MLAEIWPYHNITFGEDRILESTTICPGARVIRLDIGQLYQVMYVGDDRGYPFSKEQVGRLLLEARPSGTRTLPRGQARYLGYPMFYFFDLRPDVHYTLSFARSRNSLWEFGKAAETVSFAQFEDPRSAAVWGGIQRDGLERLISLVNDAHQSAGEPSFRGGAPNTGEGLGITVSTYLSFDPAVAFVDAPPSTVHPAMTAMDLPRDVTMYSAYYRPLTTRHLGDARAEWKAPKAGRNRNGGHGAGAPATTMPLV